VRKRLISAFLSLFLITPFVYISLNTEKAEEKSLNKYSYMFFGTFDTAITLIGFAENQEAFDEAAELTEELFNEYHRQFNQYYPYEGLNNVYYLNRNAAKSPVTVPRELFSLLLWCKQVQPLTRGRVNIAMGSVLSLWHEERENAETDPDSAKLPDMAALREAVKHANMDDVILDESKQTVFYQDEKLSLDLGAVAKGYAAELVAQVLLKGSMPHFIINAGGNVRAGHPPLDGRSDWGVAVQDPFAEFTLSADTGVLDVFYVHDQSVVTSGDYQRFYTVDGKRYHHLISPDTLMPSENMRSVTIITRDSGFADLLSTVVFLMPFEEGLEYVLSLDGVEAMWVLNDRSVYMTPGAKNVALSSGALPQ